jgi:hypothetical protein
VFLLIRVQVADDRAQAVTKMEIVFVSDLRRFAADPSEMTKFSFGKTG